MNYALIENNIVANVIWLYSGNAHDFPNAVALGDRPVAIGDSYIDGRFFRDGGEVLTALETAEREKQDMQNALESLLEVGE